VSLGPLGRTDPPIARPSRQDDGPRRVLAAGRLFVVRWTARSQQETGFAQLAEFGGADCRSPIGLRRPPARRKRPVAVLLVETETPSGFRNSVFHMLMRVLARARATGADRRSAKKSRRLRGAECNRVAVAPLDGTTFSRAHRTLGWVKGSLLRRPGLARQSCCHTGCGGDWKAQPRQVALDQTCCCCCA